MNSLRIAKELLKLAKSLASGNVHGGKTEICGGAWVNYDVVNRKIRK